MEIVGEKVNFIISSSYLFKELQILGSVVNNNNTLPILDNFLLELNKNTLTVTASDLETSISVVLDIESESECLIAVSAKLLLDILKSFAEQPLTFTINENNSLEISSQSGKYSIAYISGEEFPKTIQLENPSTSRVPCGSPQ